MKRGFLYIPYMKEKMPKLDLCGLPCPQPVLECRKFLEQGQVQSFAVYLDNEAASSNVQRFLEQRGFGAAAEKEGALWRVVAVKRESGRQNDALPAEQPEKKIIVFITTETLGRGDDDLGARLMATFLATLPEMGDSLWRVILLNGGVKLAAAQGDALQSLRELERAGVAVLVCGACLTHYGLTEKKAVGETSNMLDIVSSLSLADMVVRP